MIGDNMKKHNLKDFKMNRKTLLLACLTALFSTSGCALFQKSEPQDNAVYVNTEEEICPQGACETDPFINYTDTRAEFREYGELSERDIIVSQAEAGNNISAAIPPTIEDEVVSYEEQVDQDLAQDNSQSEEQNEQSAQNEEVPAEEVVVAEVETPAEDASSSNDEDQGEDPVKDWYAEEGQNLKALLTKWSEESGWRLVWNTNRNYVLTAGAMFRGRFADVSSALIRAFARARPAPIATFYKGNRVLVVETMEDENAYD